MAELVLDRLGRVFGANWAVVDLSLTITDGDFVTLLGPSGCGKTTILRMIAGFLAPSTGRIILDGHVLSSVEERTLVPPERRAMGMVFQSYAVWPHMNVFQNVAYPLHRMGGSEAEVKTRTHQALSLVHLDGLEARYAHELSGGQQQRVALARALVMEPAVLLLDEPLSNLDATLRDELRGEIKDLHERLGITVVYVTHDQDEAMALSKRIAVMHAGRLIQVAAPVELYERPATPFVATLVGVANFLHGTVEGREGDALRVRLSGGVGTLTLPARDGVPPGPVLICVRPEAFVFHPEGPVRGRLLRRTYLGNRFDCVVQLGELTVRVYGAAGIQPAVGEEVRLTVTRAIIYPASSVTMSSGCSAT